MAEVESQAQQLILGGGCVVHIEVRSVLERPFHGAGQLTDGSQFGKRHVHVSLGVGWRSAFLGEAGDTKDRENTDGSILQ